MHEYVASALRERPWQAVPLSEPQPLEALPTPALVLDRPAFEANLLRMRDHLATYGKAARPHAKTHKCPIISHAQIGAGAVGICVAKVGEAVAHAAAGVQQILVTSPVTHVGKLGVLASVARQIDGLDLVVDSLVGAELLRSHWPHDARLGVLLDIDVQMGRTGNRSAAVLRRIHGLLADDPRFDCKGLQHYAGNLMHIAGYAERRERSLSAWEQALALAAEVFDSEPDIVTGCGTGTFDIDVAVPAITDLQVGSYIFMDREYQQIEGRDSASFEAFTPSLSVACTAISAPTEHGVTVDGGFKAFASDSVAPLPLDLPDATFRFAGDEHGVVLRGKGDQEPLLGRVLSFMVPHCDPTVNLHDAYWVRDADGLVRELWPITARGAVW